MLIIFENVIKKLHRFYREDKFVNDLLKAIAKKTEEFSDFSKEVYEQFFFDKLTISLPIYEKLLKIEPLKGQSIESRRFAIEAKWKNSGHNSINNIKEICEIWSKNSTEPSFEGGKIKLKFLAEFGMPKKLDILLKSINEVKPAHIGIFCEFKYLLIKDIHKKIPVQDMQNLPISQFSSCTIV